MKKELTIDADVQNLETVLDFVNTILEEQDCSPKVEIQLDVAVEEIYVNIANYAYSGETGKAYITVEVGEAASLLPDLISPNGNLFSNYGDADTIVNKLTGNVFIITFKDSGMPYDPLEKPDPDVTLSAEERAIGGLGIFMVKKSMDLLQYEHKDGMNVFSLVKCI